MAGIDLKVYHSQMDGDAPDRGDCVETCCKMIDTYLTGRQISVKDIVANGDGDGTFTSVDGAKKAANWLGWGLNVWTTITPQDIIKWLNEGRFVIAVVTYGKIPAKYKQDTFTGGHAILLTGIDESNNAIRYADPLFWGARREEGFMNNGKWISWADLKLGWADQSFLGFTNVKTKKDYEPAQDFEALFNTCAADKANLYGWLKDSESKIAVLNIDIGEKTNTIAQLTTERDNLSKTVHTLEEELKTKAQDYASNAQKLTEAVNTLTGENKVLAENVSELMKDKLVSGETIRIKTEENKQLSGKLRELESVETENKKLEEYLDSATEENARLLNEIGKYKKDSLSDFVKKIFDAIFKKK